MLAESDLRTARDFYEWTLILNLSRAMCYKTYYEPQTLLQT